MVVRCRRPADTRKAIFDCSCHEFSCSFKKKSINGQKSNYDGLFVQKTFFSISLVMFFLDAVKQL